MGTIVDLSLPLDALPLGRALASTRGFSLEFDRVVPLSARSCLFVWLLDRSLETPRADRLTSFERSAEYDEAIDRLDRIEVVDDSILYRVRWTEYPSSVASTAGQGAESKRHSDVRSSHPDGSIPSPPPEQNSERARARTPDSPFVRGVVESGGAILEASAATEWTVRLRFDGSERIAAFQQYCREHDVPIELNRVTELEEGPSVAHAELTTPQADALRTAARLGYFDRPRETTLEEIADALDISPQAAGGRIRRGVSNLVSDAVPLEGERENDERDATERS